MKLSKISLQLNRTDSHTKIQRSIHNQLSRSHSIGVMSMPPSRHLQEMSPNIPEVQKNVALQQKIVWTTPLNCLECLCHISCRNQSESHTKNPSHTKRHSHTKKPSRTKTPEITPLLRCHCHLPFTCQTFPNLPEKWGNKDCGTATNTCTTRFNCPMSLCKCPMSRLCNSNTNRAHSKKHSQPHSTSPMSMPPSFDLPEIPSTFQIFDICSTCKEPSRILTHSHKEAFTVTFPYHSTSLMSMPPSFDCQGVPPNLQQCNKLWQCNKTTSGQLNSVSRRQCTSPI